MIPGTIGIKKICQKKDGCSLVTSVVKLHPNTKHIQKIHQVIIMTWI